MSKDRNSSGDGSRKLYQQLRNVAAKGSADDLRDLIVQAKLSGYLNPDHLSTGLRFAAKFGHPASVRTLLEFGASADVEENKHYPALYLAVSQQKPSAGHLEIAEVLLSGPYASCPANIEWKDDKGRTILMTAAWRGNIDAVRLLLKHGADIHATDKDRRSILHNLAADPVCRWTDDVIDLILSTTIDITLKDNQERTALHWAASTGKPKLIRRLLAKATLVESRPVSTTSTIARDKTPLHLACSAKPANPEVVELLLRYGADPAARSDGNWTCLHNSVETQGSVTIVRILLNACPSLLNARTSNGMTALHYAAQAGQDDVVTYLLSLPGIVLDYKDSFHSTPLLRAAQERRTAIVNQLAPFNNAQRLSQHAVNACKGFRASIYDFRPGSDGHQNYGLKPPSVYETLYGTDPKTGKPSISTLISSSKRPRRASRSSKSESWPQFKWIHLPANNIAWAETLVAKAFLEADTLDIEGFKAMDRSFSQQHRGHLIHSHYMRTTCTRSAKQVLEQLSSGLHLQVENSSKLVSPIDSTTDKNFENIGADYKPLKASNIAFFSPYLHFETATGLKQMKEAIKNSTEGEISAENRNLSDDEYLISAYLHSRDLQPRRTLDQSYLPGIDTEKRDESQVIGRYCKKYEKEDKVFMVDQLWMWILGPNLIITSFPQRWKQPKNAPLNFLDGIIEDMNSKTQPPVQSVYDLALLITNRCAGAFDRHRPEDDEYQFLDMFESSIGTVNDQEAKLYEDFYDASAEVHRLLNTDNLRANYLVSSTNSRYTHLVNRFLDIDKEMTLLKEIKDIRDELNMLSRVLNEQTNALTKLGKAFAEDLAEMEISQCKRKINDQKSLIDLHLKEMERMSKLAAAIEKSLLSLLDLKQRQASTFEARFSRDQAAGTIQQGQVILIFTMTTIVFLPVNFIASFFAINIQEFPRAPESQAIPLLYVSKYMFGIGLSISLLLIFVAFSVIPLGAKATEVRTSWRLPTFGRRILGVENKMNTESLQAQSSGLRRLISNSRRSIEARKEGFSDSSSPETERGLFSISQRTTNRDLENG